MKLLFGQKYYGKDTSEVPSGFLVWIIEEYDKAEWSLINACKTELSARMKLDWTPPTDKDRTIQRLTTELDTLRATNTILLDTVYMASIYRGNPYMIESFLASPKLMYDTIRNIKSVL